MGYRSDVRCLIYGPREQIDAILMREALGAKRLDYWNDYISTYDAELFRNREEREIVHVIDFEATGVKWYDGYPEVDGFNAFRNELAGELEEGSKIAIEWACVGEETADIEVNHYGDPAYVLDVHRDIYCELSAIDDVEA